jgi:hypothetical protein
MLKQKSSQLSRMRLYVSEFGAEVFSTDGLVLYCKVCEDKVAADKKYTIQQHITCDKHLHGIQKRNEQTTSLTQPMYSEYVNSNFNLDFCREFLSANIPLHKLSHATHQATTPSLAYKPIACSSLYDSLKEESMSSDGSLSSYELNIRD